MHFDFTVHFWALAAELVTLVGVVTFLIKVYRLLKRTVSATISILEEHHTMYAWFLKQNGVVPAVVARKWAE